MGAYLARRRAILCLLPLLVLFAVQWALEAGHPIEESAHPLHHRHTRAAFHQACGPEGHNHCCVHSQGWMLTHVPALSLSHSVSGGAFSLPNLPSRRSFDLLPSRGPPELS